MKFDAPALLAHLIEYGYAPHPAGHLPPEWRAAYDAVAATSGTRTDRMIAFERAIEKFPFADNLKWHVRTARENRNFHRDLRSATDPVATQSVVEWCLEGFLSRPSLTLLVGEPGAKKTLLSLDLAVCVAVGKPWLGHPTIACPVLYVDEEIGPTQFVPRLQAALQGNQADSLTALHFLSMPAFDLSSQWDCDELQEKALAAEAGLIIIDALADVSRGSENSVHSMRPIFANLRRVAEASHAAVLVLHHTNKAGYYRGSTAIAAGVDLLLAIDSPPESSLVSVRPLKARNFMPNPIHAQAHFFEGEVCFSIVPPSSFPPLSENHIVILEYLATSGPAKTPQLIAASNKFPDTVRGYINDLLVMDFIERGDGNIPGNVALYHLTSKGRDFLRENSLRCLTEPGEGAEMSQIQLPHNNHKPLGRFCQRP